MADGNVGAGLGYAADLLHTTPGIDSCGLLAAIVASSEDAIVGLSSEGTILSWNHAAEELFGYPADDALGRSVFITVEDTAMERELRGLLERIHAGDHVRHYETVRTTKSGERRDVSITLSPVHDAGGNVVGASKIVRDVTGRKRAEAEKRDFTFLVEHSHDFVGISGLDLVPTFVNESGLKMVGLDSLDEARRISVLDHFFPEDRQFIVEEFLPLVLRDSHGEIEIRFRRFRTGDPIWVIYSVLTLCDDQGNPTGYATISQDVTLRKQSEESLRASESRLRMLMDNLPDGAVYQITQDSEVDKRFTFVSGGIDRIFGVTPERAVADPAALYGTIHEEDRDQLLAAEVESLRSRRRFDCEFRHHMPDGEIRWVHCQSAPREVDGLVIWEGVLLDVTDRKRAEAALGESEARYRCLFESIDEGFCIIEVLFGESGEAVDYRFMTVNPVFERQSGLKDVVGRRMRELAPDHEPHWFEVYGRVVRTGEPVRFVNEAKALGGRWFDVNAFRIGGPESRQIGVLFTDISDRIRAEAAVRESERRTRTILESITDAFFALDRNWRFTYVNGRAEEFLGRTRVELVGRGLWDEFPDARESEFEGYYRTAMDESFPVAFEAYYPSHERWYDVNVYPSADGLSVYFRDANQRRRAERTNRFLADASAALAGLLDFESTLQRVARLAVPDFADWCVVDLLVDGGVRRLAVTSGDPAKEGLAQELVEKYPAQLSAPLGVGRVLRTGQPELIEVVSPLFLESVTQNDDHLRIAREIGLRSYVSVPLLSQGRVLGALTFLTAESGRRYDETDLRVATDLAGRAAVAIENARLYREVREADRRKDEFLAMLAHELRNPLAPIRSGLDLLKLSDAEPEVVSLMAGQVEHIVRLVDDLLDVSRILRGRVELKLKPVELSELVQRAVETVRPAIDTQRQEFSVSLPAEPVPLEADPVRLTQVFTNLLGNASKYTEPGGRIDLTAERDGEYIEVRVSDTGVGIDPELLPHVFELFRQSTRSIDRAQGGLGIGLTIVKSLTEMHGGHVLARSEGAGRGSDFVIRLPVLNYDTAAATTSTDGPPVPARRILVVDDNVPAAKLLVRLLRKLGPHEVVTAHDGEGALTAAKAYRPDLILLDIGLPRLDGYEVARRLRERPDIGETVIIALTGYGTEDDRRRSAEAGFDDHVTKPPSVEMLQKVLAHPKLAPRSGRQ